MRQRLSLLALVGLAAFPLLGQTPVSPRNWERHPAIREIRALVAQIDSLPLVEQADSADCGRGYIGITARLFTDSAGRARKYLLAGGSDDSAGEARLYFDATGQLRFRFSTTNAVNGTRQEDRFYYDAQGRELYHDRRRLAGPGYNDIWDVPAGINPVTDFHNLCGPG